MNGINIITANFSNGRNSITRKIYQYDYGQIISIKNLNLPNTFEVHISNSNIASTAQTYIGNNNEIEIPDKYLISGEDIYLWIFLHATVSDGETRYTITIPVQKKPKPIGQQPTPVEKNTIDQYIAALEANLNEMKEATKEAKDEMEEATNLAKEEMQLAIDKANDIVLKYPKIVENYWYVYDVENQVWLNTQVKALGEDGVGIKNIVFNSDYTLTFVFTDDSSYTTDSIRGAKGDKGDTGATPNFTIGTIQTLPENEYATVNIQGTPENPILNFKIPRGRTGNDGNPGPTPNIEIGTVENLNPDEIPYVIKTGTKENPILHFGLLRGQKGDKGDKGDDYTLTEEDKQNIADMVDIPVDDVQVNGNSIVNDGVAEIPLVSHEKYGLVKYGAGLTLDGSYLVPMKASGNQIKAGTTQYSPIVPFNQHNSVFYGLAKVAGDTTQSASTNPLGTYTDAAKQAIQAMLGIDTAIADAVGQITSFEFRVVQDLPATGEVGIIYLVAHAHGTGDIYDEYIWIGTGYEKIGNTDIDLSNYALKSELPTKVSDLTNDSGYATSTYVDGEIDTLEASIPTNNNQLTNGAGYQTENDVKSVVAESLEDVEALIADEFDASLSYSVGDYVLHDGKLYRFTADHATGAFDGTDAVEVNVTDELVRDVTINGSSVVNGGVAEIPIAGTNNVGVVKPHMTYGIGIFTSDGSLRVMTPTEAEVKAGIITGRFTPVSGQHISTFYGLAKAAGDTTQSQSANAVGTYTDNAKAAIKAMLDITGECQTVTVTGATPVITATQNTRYVCGEVTSLDFTPSANGICDVIFTSGFTVTVLTLPNTVILPSWFDATALEANTTYEISISDGVYGAVMVW